MTDSLLYNKNPKAWRFCIGIACIIVAVLVAVWLEHTPGVTLGDGCVIPPISHVEPLFLDGFESGELASFWESNDKSSGRYEPGAMVITDDSPHSGRYAVSVTVHEGDIDQPGDPGVRTERAELDSQKRHFLGREILYRFTVRIPYDFPIIDNRLVVSQIKQKGLHGGPLFAQRFVDGRHFFTIRRLGSNFARRFYFDLPDLTPEVWHRMEYRVRFSTESDGFVLVRMNEKEVAKYCGPTADEAAQGRFYHKIGLYRDRWPDPMTIYFDDYEVSELFPSERAEQPGVF